MSFVPVDPVLNRVAAVITRLDAGVAPDDVEDDLVDLKEEAGRRDPSGAVLPGTPQNPIAADQLAMESACMANSLTGGALIVGIADDGAPIGTQLDGVWVRSRILELTNRAILPVVTERQVKGVRCLVVRVQAADESVRYRDKLMMRVDDDCIEVPAATGVAAPRDRPD